jgi:HlyD family secretion protein
MDKKISQARISNKRWAGLSVFLILISLASYAYINSDPSRSQRIKKQHLSLSKISLGEFREYIPLNGKVMPKTTVYLDAVEGGRVERLFVEAGSFVSKGQPLIALSNTSLQLDVISREAQIAEQLNNLRNTRLAMEQDKLNLKRDILDVNYQLLRLKLLMTKHQALLAKKLIAEHQYLAVKNEYDYYVQRLAISKERREQDEKVRNIQVLQLEESTGQLNNNLNFARKNLDNLVVKAPVDGFLTGLTAELGESKSRGVRLGQIDNLNSFKVSSLVDEFYIDRVQPGQIAKASINSTDYQLVIKKIYPQVNKGQFKVDLVFGTQMPKNMRRGQNIQLKLQLGDQQQAILLPRGGFYQQSGGNWIFVVNANGDQASRRMIKLGRSNPDFFEVLSGLQVTDQVITSNYTGFDQAERLTLE